MHIITAADHDAQGVTTSTATPRQAHNLEGAQSWMVAQAGDLLQSVGTTYRVAVLEPRHIRLEKVDGTGGTTWTITD